MIHYAQCPNLFVMISALRAPLPTSPDPLVRLGLKDHSRDSLLVVSCCFAGYHACIRHAIANQFTNDTLCAHHREQVLAIFADYFCAAAHELGIHCVARSDLNRAISVLPVLGPA